ncbi:MAG: styrene monooxygenase/indole monooxygenase family protein [Pseudonocardiaceae bacterium]
MAIVGAGQAGIVLAAELLRRGYGVSLYSDQTPEEYVASNGRPTACLFGDSVVRERELGLDFWADRAPSIERIQLDLCLTIRCIAFSLRAPLRRPALAVDQRLKFSRGMTEMARRGARLEFARVSVEALERIAVGHDLTVVTVGHRGVGSELFARDASRCRYDRPRRRLFMVNITGYEPDAGVGQDQLKLSFIPGIGEVFWVPFYDVDAGVSRSIVIESVPGGPGDRFGELCSADEGLKVLKDFVRTFLPWESDFLAPATATHARTWLKGAVVPTVRKPVGRLPSGAPVLGLGDAVIVNDPLAGQGANNATRMAHFFAERIQDRGEQPFDPEWLARQFDDFWEYSRYVNDFSNILLEPLRGFQRNLLISASRRPDIAEEIFEGFNNPPCLFPWFTEPRAAREFLTAQGVNGRTLSSYQLGVVRNVLRQKVRGRH